MKYLLLVFLLSPVFAANHYIRAGAAGASTGASWANAWPNFASVVWTRGDTYFVAGGNYNEDVTVTKALSGASWIYIKKANTTDNSGDAGWSSTYELTQAVINGRVQLWDGYISWNGVTGSGTSGHGIKVYNSAAATHVMLLDDSTGPYSVQHTELKGAGYAYGATGFDALINNNAVSAKKSLYVAYCWLHDVTRNGLTVGGLVGTSYADYGMLVENNVISETGGCTDVNVHGQGVQISFGCDDAYLIISGNVFRNTVGSGCISYLGGGSNHNFSRIYNNLFYITNKTTYNIVSPGPIWTHATSTTSTNIEVLNNTFYNIGQSTANDEVAQIVFDGVSKSANTIKNNIWENCYFSATHSANAQSNNAYYNNTGAGVPSGTTNQVNGSATTFTNAAGEDFTLASGGYAIGAGADLSATFTTDKSGATRSAPWDIGAFKYVPNVIGVPATPVITGIAP